MMNGVKFPKIFYDLLPVPIVVSVPDINTRHSLIIYVNDAFTEEFGWHVSEIPDKQTWWDIAYPDPDYRRVIERQWELEIQNATEGAVNYVSMEVNITVKSQKVKRYEITALLDDETLVGCHVSILKRAAIPLIS